MTGLLALLLGAAFAAPGAASQKRVDPVAIPSRPAPSERVVLRFRARETLDGVYHAEARRAGCVAVRGRVVMTPAKGRVVRLKLSPPHGGWCAETYRATVVFKQTVRCPQPIQCGDSAEVTIGSTTFTARA